MPRWTWRARQTQGRQEDYRGRWGETGKIVKAGGTSGKRHTKPYRVGDSLGGKGTHSDRERQR